MQDNSDQQYITTALSVIILDIQQYKTRIKKLATIDVRNHGFSQKTSGNHTFAK